jgi:tetratricopeptide (TPR) repeat protein
MSTYEAELAKTRADVESLAALVARDARDLEKRVRLAYRQFHLASLTESDVEYNGAQRLIGAIVRDFGPQEDICLLKANLDGRFHRLWEVKEDLAMCSALAQRPAGRAVLADIAFQEGRYDEAVSTVKALISECRAWDTLARLAHWQGQLGAWEEADTLYMEAEDELTSKEMRSFAWLELQRGALAQSRGRLDKARAHYQRAANAFPGHWRTDQHLAGLLAAEGSIADAETVLTSVVARAPKPEFLQALGELLTFSGKAVAARPLLNAALSAFLASVQEGGVHYYHHLADLYGGVLELPAEAVIWARKDVGVRSNFKTQSALAWALLQSGEWAEGLEWIRLALESGVQDRGIFDTAARLFRDAGDEAQGDRYARAATAVNPNAPVFHMHH